MLMVVESNGVCVKDPLDTTENNSETTNAETSEVESKLLISVYIVYFLIYP